MRAYALLAAGAIVGRSAEASFRRGADTKAALPQSPPHRPTPPQVSIDAFAPAARPVARADVRRQVFQQDPDQKRGPASDAERPP